MRSVFYFSRPQPLCTSYFFASLKPRHLNGQHIAWLSSFVVLYNLTFIHNIQRKLAILTLLCVLTKQKYSPHFADKAKIPPPCIVASHSQRTMEGELVDSAQSSEAESALGSSDQQLPAWVRDV